jgi:DNA-binding IclR family transcriptional regulator
MAGRSTAIDRHPALRAPAVRGSVVPHYGCTFRDMEQSAIDKALDVLFYLHASPLALGVSELGRSLDLPRSSAHRLLSSLKRRALVEQDSAGRYRPGVGLITLAAGVLERDPLVAAARPVMEAGAESLGDTFFLVAARGGRLLVLDKAEGTGVLRASPRLGSTIPVHATAVGKLYLAHAPEQLASSDAEDARPRFTAQTLADDAALRADADAAAARGYATNRQEWIAGLHVVAAPILVADRMHGAVCAALPTTRMQQLAESEVAARVMAAAERIARRLRGLAEPDTSARKKGNET